MVDFTDDSAFIAMENEATKNWKKVKPQQETTEFWKGSFGKDYQERQKKSEVGSVESNIHFFKRMYRSDALKNAESILEVGAGTGQNIRALHQILPETKLRSIEVNSAAAEQIPYGEVYVCDALGSIEFPESDLVLTKGFLIHIHPQDIVKMYRKIHQASQKYILLCEYYNPTEVEVNYRGHTAKLWKRDFAGEMLHIYPDLELVDYGFTYHLDQYPQDDLTWFLLRKNNV